MAVPGGHRFAVSMGEVFPAGVYAFEVSAVEDFNEKTRARTPAKDKATGLRIWAIKCRDRTPDEQARGRKDFTVKIAAEVCPTLPEEIVPGSGIRSVEFSGLTATPYVEEGRDRSRLAYSFWAAGVHPQGKAPGLLAGRAGGPAPTSAPGGDGKAA